MASLQARILTVAIIAAVMSLAPAASPGCTCAEARTAVGGWCAAHEVGFVAGIKIRSGFLFDAVDAHGHEVRPDSFTCTTCRTAIETDGFCAEHRIGFVGGMAYFSRLTYLLARGEVRPTSELRCSTCRKNAESHGWCVKCGVGMAGNIALGNRQDFDDGVRAIHILEVANKAAKRCDDCAVAILTDTRCPFCKITYKDGKPIEAAPAK